MCYEERYYSEWAKRSAKKRETAQPTVERRQPVAKPDATKPEPEKVKDRQLEPV